MREKLGPECYGAELLRLVQCDDRVEYVPLARASGRVLAEPVTSAVDIPGFDNSAMDGYAVRFDEVREPSSSLRVVGDIPAGSPDDPLVGYGECVRIMTGAAIPSFADTVVAVEDTDGGTAEVTILKPPSCRGTHVRRRGEDISVADLVAPAGAELTPGAVSALGAAGVTDVGVRLVPVVAVGATGDELVTDGSPLRRGQIYESNSLGVAAALTRDGAATERAVLPDDAERLVGWLDRVTGRAAMVVLTGGASVGAYDVVRDVLTSHARGTFRHVAMQPGKPQGWGVWPGGVPVVSLPGNPVAAMLSYEMFVRPMLDKILGRPDRPWLDAVAATGWACPKGGRRQLLPVRLGTGGDGRLVAVPTHHRGSASHVVTALASANGYAMVSEDADAVAPGDPVKVRWV